MGAKISPLDSGTWKFMPSLRSIAANYMTQDNETGSWTWLASSRGTSVFSTSWNIVKTPAPTFEFYPLVWFPGNSPKLTQILQTDFSLGTGYTILVLLNNKFVSCAILALNPFSIYILHVPMQLTSGQFVN